ncbi:hypothetical protein HNR77_006062 [Paenibacillus sp. JGP012]|uniref:Cap15 family cyclic dinucleotide receptor domain-containing protein n=1 Tax=Paenibacillus sp. JGP012 TaxID=2735914 RepID=UPI0016160A8B|nr:hypothetical protein [Paenibacillus sp. JGP012]MBB6024916.1 hypothetical protein [Paenibacillus sp. JGP012]
MYNSSVYWRIWIILGILIFVTIVLFKGPPYNIFIIVSAASAAGISLLIEALLFKRIIWMRFPHLFHPWLCTVPYIGGKWEGTIQSDYIDQESGKRVEPIRTSMEIRHEFDRIKVTLETDKSFSSSYTSDIWIDEAGRKYLCYTYYNDADENRDTNPNHDGTAKLRISLDTDDEPILKGHYFTGRKTTGKMEFTRVNKKNSKI